MYIIKKRKEKKSIVLSFSPIKVARLVNIIVAKKGITFEILANLRNSTIATKLIWKK